MNVEREYVRLKEELARLEAEAARADADRDHALARLREEHGLDPDQAREFAAEAVRREAEQEREIERLVAAWEAEYGGKL